MSTEDYIRDDEVERVPILWVVVVFVRTLWRWFQGDGVPAV